MRHAETEWNQKRLCQGQTDVPLNGKGREEARAFAEKLSDFPVECIVTSPLTRAIETAREIHRVHPKAQFHTVSELAERCWGDLEGISSQEMYDIEALEEASPSYSPGKQVEEREQFQERVRKGIEMAQTYHPHPLIVSHGRVFVETCLILGIPLLRQLPNCQLVEVFSSSDGWNIRLIKEFAL